MLPDGLLLQQHQPAGQPGQLQPGYCSSVLDHRVTVRYKLFSQLSMVSKLIKTSRPFFYLHFSSTKLNHMSHAAYITGSDIRLTINEQNMEGEQDSVCRAVVHNFEVAQNLDVERALTTELDLNSSTEDPLSTGVVPFLKVLKIYISRKKIKHGFNRKQTYLVEH